MKNTLTDLNNYLFEQLERLNDDSLTNEQLEQEIRKTDSIVKVSEKIIPKEQREGTGKAESLYLKEGF